MGQCPTHRALGRNVDITSRSVITKDQPKPNSSDGVPIEIWVKVRKSKFRLQLAFDVELKAEAAINE